MNPIPDPFARHFAATVCRLAPGGPARAPDGLFLAAALAARATFSGKQVCLDLSAPPPDDDESPLPPGLPDLLRSPACSFAVAADPKTEADAFKPLVLESDRLYLQRYWLYENTLAQLLKDRRSAVGDQRSEIGGQRSEIGGQRSEVSDQKSETGHLPTSDLRSPTSDLRPPTSDLLSSLSGLRSPTSDLRPPTSDLRSLTRLSLDPSQLAAVRLALANRLTVITGGPGTGKTTIVSVVLAALLRDNPALTVRLCAPTGKAQARLKEALDHELAAHLLPDGDPALKARLASLQSSTIHRLLSARPPLWRFAFNAANPFPADVLVVDEVSMVDLALMVKLLSAAPPRCRVILLGDSDQLAAVETGAALAEICDAWSGTPSVARLSLSHRFDPGCGIGLLKDAINSGDPSAAWAILADNAHSSLITQHSSLSLHPSPATPDQCAARLAAFLSNHPFRAYLAADTPEAAFPLFDAFRILCATRRGPCGTDHVNRAVQSLLGIAPYGHGYPLMVTVNDYTRRLFNGDIGLCLRAPGHDAPRVFFPDYDTPGAYRSFVPADLPPHAPVFAMTVHKAQGSGFDDVLLILPSTPPRPSLLTRELLYTGLTRAKSRCTVWADESLFKAAVARRARRLSGLKDKLSPPR